MQSDSIKLSIKLTEEQIGAFPVSTESLWFDKTGNYYVLKNIPQFVDEAISNPNHDIDNLLPWTMNKS